MAAHAGTGAGRGARPRAALPARPLAAAGLLTCLAAATLLVGGCSGCDESSRPAVMDAATVEIQPEIPTPPSATALRLSPEGLQVPRGQSVAAASLASFDDGSERDVTAMADWSSAAPEIAVVSATGRVTGIAGGSTTISARFGGLVASSAVMVTDDRPVSIAVTGAGPTLPRGGRGQLTAVATFFDGATMDVTAEATWSSSDPAVLGVSDTQATRGLVTGFSVGQARVTATLRGTSGGTDITIMAPAAVKISVDLVTAGTAASVAPAVPRGVNAGFRAKALYSDGRSQDVTAEVSWSAPDTPALLVPVPGRPGLFSAAAPGTAVVRAALDGVVGTLSLRVTEMALASLEIDLHEVRLPTGGLHQLRATAIFSDLSTHDVTDQAVWVSSAPAVASVSSGDGRRGLITPASPGTTSISASFSGQTDASAVTVAAGNLVSLTATPLAPNPRLAVGTELAMRATATYSDGSSQEVSEHLLWTVTSQKVATVVVHRGEPEVVVVGHAPGRTTITAAWPTDPSRLASTGVEVTDAVASSVTYGPLPLRMARDTHARVRASAHLTDGTNQALGGAVFWASADPAIVAVSNAPGIANGRVSALAPGSTSLTGTVANGTVTIPVTVTNASLTIISMAPELARTIPGRSVQYQAMGFFSDDTAQDITGQVIWQSRNLSVATISNGAGSRGVAQAHATGEATIVARLPVTLTSGRLVVEPPPTLGR